MQVQHLGYPAIICKSMDESIAFYTRAFGMHHLFTEPNRDDSESVQALLHAGGDTYLLLVGPTRADIKLAEAQLGIGSMQYLSLTVPGAELDRAYAELAASGVRASEEIRRGYERLVFLEDPNGVLITLTAWITDPPPALARADVLTRAAALRAAEAAPFLEDGHIRRAIAALGGA